MAMRRMAAERAGLVRELAAQRQAVDVRASTLERYAAAVGGEISWKLHG